MKARALKTAVGGPAGRGQHPRLRRLLAKASPMFPRRLREVTITVVGDKRMSDLHLQHLGIAGPTDVLTFELDHDSRGRCVGGEIVVCAGEARRQARSRGHRFGDELLLYAIHGALHLGGLDDRTPSGFGKMHRREDRILSAIGVGAIFARQARPGDR